MYFFVLNSSCFTELGYVHSIIKTDQVVESDALLSAAHVFKEAVICDQQQGAGIFLVIVSLSLLSVVVPYKNETAGGAVRVRQMHGSLVITILTCTV